MSTCFSQLCRMLTTRCFLFSSNSVYWSDLQDCATGGGWEHRDTIVSLWCTYIKGTQLTASLFFLPADLWILSKRPIMRHWECLSLAGSWELSTLCASLPYLQPPQAGSQHELLWTVRASPCRWLVNKHRKSSQLCGTGKRVHELQCFRVALRGGRQGALSTQSVFAGLRKGIQFLEFLLKRKCKV